MNRKQKTENVLRNKHSLWTNIFFIAMTVFALVFANERFQADGAYYLFKVINFEKFQVEHQRFVLIFSQWLPLLGVKLGLPMKAIIYLNSISNVFFFYCIFLYCVKYLRDETAGIIVILFSVLGVLHIQFTPMYEIWYGVMLLVPIRSHLVTGRYYALKDLVIVGAFMITVLFAHPLLFIPLIFILMLDAIERFIINWKLFFLTVIIFAGWYITKKLMLSEYEAGKMSMLDTSWNKAYTDLLHPSYYWFLIKFFFTWYTIPTIIFITTFFMLYARGARYKAIFIALFFSGHIILINYTHVMDHSLTPYFERMYMPLMPIIFFPFMYDIFTQFFLRNVVGGILIAMVVSWRFARFIQVGLEYREQTEQAEQLITQAQLKGGTKFQVSNDDIGEYKCLHWIDWSFTMESMLRSAADGKDKTVTIASYSDFVEGNNPRLLSNKNYIMRRWEIMNDNTVNRKYFVMKDGGYVKLEAVCK